MKKKSIMFTACFLFSLVACSQAPASSAVTNNSSTQGSSSSKTESSGTLSSVPEPSSSTEVGTSSQTPIHSSSESNLPPQPSSQSSSEAESSSSSVTSSSSDSLEPSIARFTITWKNYDGTVLETDADVAEGATPTYDGSTPTRPSDDTYSYVWSGWSPQVAPAHADQTYTATYSYERIKVEYVVDFDLDGGSSASYTGPQTVESFKDVRFFYDCQKEGWTFRGWSYAEQKIVDEKGTALSAPTMKERMTFVAVYSQTARMTIETNMPEAGEITGEGEYPYNTYVDVAAHPHQGYKFVGWYYQDTLLSNTEDYRYMMWDEDVTIEARFRLDDFTLTIRTNNKDYGLVLLKLPLYNEYRETYEAQFDYTGKVTIAAYSRTDVRFLGWYDGSNDLVSTNAVYTLSMPSRDYALEAKWDHFTVNYELGGGTNSEENPSHYTSESSPIPLKEPSRDAYDFLGWKRDGVGPYVTEIDPSWMDNVTLVAVWDAHSYSIIYELNGGTNDPSNPESYTIEGETIELKDPKKAGYTFEGWFSEDDFQNQVTSIECESCNDTKVYAKWAIVAYSITYDLDGGTNDPSNPASYTVEDDFAFSNPSKTGYAFSGWYDDEANRFVDGIQKGTVGALRLSAHWEVAQNNLVISSEDKSKGIVRIVSGTGYTNEEITVSATPAQGFLFEGWYHESTKVSDDATYAFVMPAGDYSLVAHFLLEKDWLVSIGAIPALSEDGKTVTYGFYPQSHVSDSELISTLDALPPATGPNGWYLYDWEYYVKVTANTIFEGATYSSGTKIVDGESYWFKCEPIRWKVLSSADNDFFLASERILTPHRYNEHYKGTNENGYYANNYENSEIRAWLNNDFLNTAFCLNDSHIRITAVDNSAASTGYQSNPFSCDTTDDKIFLLSRAELTNPDYGLKNPSYICYATDYTFAKGCCKQSRFGACVWWTRSPYCDIEFPYRVQYVNEMGTLQENASSGSAIVGVRPALHLMID